jgi:hypothetical protein
VHKFDNALGGTAFDDGNTGLLVNLGNYLATGRWWSARRCATGDPDHDHEPTNLNGAHAQTVWDQLEPLLTGPLDGELPVYPPGPLCNTKGLTSLGQYVIRKMAQRGMIVETDHMSVKTRRGALDLLEQLHYPGVISSHSWGDEGSQKRILDLGGMVGPYAGGSTSYVKDAAQARADKDPQFLCGIGFGSDTNGLGKQGAPRLPTGGAGPVTYPFQSFDGSVTLDRQVSGTKTYDINVDGVAQYGLYPDWIQDVRKVGGDAAVDAMANGAESYLQMWQRAIDASAA